MGIELAVAAISLVGGAIAQNKQRKAQKAAAAEARKQRQLAAAQAEAKAARERKMKLTELRQRRAATLAETQGAGAFGSSAQLGAAGALTSTAAGTVGFMDQSAGVQRGINVSAERQVGYQESAAKAGAAAAGFGQLFKMSGGFGTIGSGVQKTGIFG